MLHADDKDRLKTRQRPNKILFDTVRSRFPFSLSPEGGNKAGEYRENIRSLTNPGPTQLLNIDVATRGSFHS